MDCRSRHWRQERQTSVSHVFKSLFAAEMRLWGKRHNPPWSCRIRWSETLAQQRNSPELGECETLIAQCCRRRDWRQGLMWRKSWQQTIDAAFNIREFTEWWLTILRSQCGRRHEEHEESCCKNNLCGCYSSLVRERVLSRCPYMYCVFCLNRTRWPWSKEITWYLYPAQAKSSSRQKIPTDDGWWKSENGFAENDKLRHNGIGRFYGERKESDVPDASSI